MKPVSVSVADVVELGPRTTPTGGVRVAVLEIPRVQSSLVKSATTV